MNNKILSIDPLKAQQEVYKGRYSINMSSKIPMNLKIQKFAGEDIAFHLHKKRDFLMRLEKHAIGT